MFFIGIFLCVVIAVIVGIAIPKRGDYSKSDRIGVVFNVILSVLYVPMSLFSVFSLFAADSMLMYSEPARKIVELMITVGLSMPFVSILCIALSVFFRKKQKRALSFTVQFIPCILFIIMIVAFEWVSVMQA